MGRLFPASGGSSLESLTKRTLYGKTVAVSDTPDLSTVSGLETTATQYGLAAKTKKILEAKGEKNKTFWSGGFISDVFDTLNALQYGVTGLLKGKSFMEGVKTRQSFSDKDALGEYGLPGVIGGVALDIAVDPLTYVAPWTLVKKIPVVGKVVSAAGKIAEESKVGKYLGEKLIYAFGQDPVYKGLNERRILGVSKGTFNISKMVDGVVNLKPETAQKLLTTDEKGAVIRRPLGEVWGSLTEDEKWVVAKNYSVLDALGKEAADLGLLGKKTQEEHIGEYIKNAYLKYEKPEDKASKVFGTATKGVKGIKARKDLPQEVREELGQIKNPAYLLFKSMFDLNKDIENTKFFNAVAEKFGKEAAEEGFKKLPDTQRLFTTSTGQKIEMLTKLKELNQSLKAPLKELKSTFKADKETLSQIKNIEKDLTDLSKVREEEFYKFFQEGEKVVKETAIPRKIGALPKELISWGEKMKKFATLGEFKASPEGMELEKLYEQGWLQRRGYKSIEDLFDKVKNPYAPAAIKEGETILKGNLPKLIKTQKAIEDLSYKMKDVKGIDKRSINDSFRFLEDTINKINMEKEKAIEQIGQLRLGELSGKYVPEMIHKDLTELMKPVNYGLGSKVVAGFKYGKVILNLPTHFRNVLSNLILNDFAGLSPARMDIYIKAMKEVFTHGKWYKEAQLYGCGVDTFAANELKNMPLSEKGMISGARYKVNKLINGIADLYQKEEEVAKMAQYIFQRTSKGLPPEEAWKIAEAATFNYSQVTPFIRQLRTSVWGFPFVTFTAKATPEVAKALVKYPTKISNIGKMRQAIENLSGTAETAREKASEPAYIKNGFYIKLPMKDSKGRSCYFDMTYILPFGDLVTGNYFDQQINRDTGLPEPVSTSLLSNSPFMNFVKEISHNQDFYGDKIWQDSDSVEKQTQDLFRHLTKTYMPPAVADQIPGGYQTDGTQRPSNLQKITDPTKGASALNQQRTLMEEMLRNVGLKVQPINADIQETYMNWEKTNALQTMLQEEGIAKEFQKTYIPKPKATKKGGGRLFK